MPENNVQPSSIGANLESAERGNSVVAKVISVDDDVVIDTGLAIAVDTQQSAKAQLVNGLLFGMGLAWRGVTVAIANSGSDAVADGSSSLEIVWGVAFGFVVIAVPLIYLLLKRKAQLLVAARTASKEGRYADAVVLTTRQQVLDKQVNFGLVFTLAVQLCKAFRVSVSSQEHYLAIALLIFVVIVYAATAAMQRRLDALPKDSDRLPLMREFSDALVSMAVYVTAVLFTDFVSVVFGITTSTSTVDIPFMLLYSVMLLAMTVVAYRGIARMGAAIGSPVVPLKPFHAFVSKVFPMCTAMAFYTTGSVFVITVVASNDYSIDTPHSIIDAALVLAVSLLIAVLGDVFVLHSRVSAAAVLNGLSGAAESSVDKLPQVLATVWRFVTHMSTAACTALATATSWIIGGGIDALATAIREEAIAGDSAARVGASVAQALVLSVVAVVASHWLAMCYKPISIRERE